MNTEHTPGPWFVYRPTVYSLPHIRSRAGGEWGVYVMDAPTRGGTYHAKVRQLADARLIAAAPELLEALREAREFLSSDYVGRDKDFTGGALARVDAAIAKATEDTP